MKMKRLVGRMRRKGAFTLIELMIVVVIVAILAMVAVPMYRANVLAAKMSEGIAGCGTIRTALRVYAAQHDGNYPTLSGVDGTALSDTLNISAADLTGKYFSASDYTVTSTATTYTITATLSDTGDTYIIDQDGTESGTFTTE